MPSNHKVPESIPLRFENVTKNALLASMFVHTKARILPFRNNPLHRILPWPFVPNDDVENKSGSKSHIRSYLEKFVFATTYR